jgi:hypothetical protein
MFSILRYANSSAIASGQIWQRSGREGNKIAEMGNWNNRFHGKLFVVSELFS